MWIEYVRKALADGQQVFRRSVLENLIKEIETEYKPLTGGSPEVVALRDQLDKSRKANRLLSAKLAHIKAIIGEGKE
jgi:hypothetical protein